LRYEGVDERLDSSRLAITNHTVGEHGPLYRCRECGTLQQPSALLGHEELVSLYREMTDERYLSEAHGRRKTARRLLDLIGAEVPAGRLLDVGCGHGLLLDEARQRGYEVVGLEPAAEAARYARETLGLDVRQEALESFEPNGPFDVIVLADVLEHTLDPTSVLVRCSELVADGGAVCIVTPDPSSLTARVAGARWWGYIAAHTFLIPRRTLRELVAATGLVIAHDVPYLRTFSLGYWSAGLADRRGFLGVVARALGRLTPNRLAVSLSLGDERVVVAHRLPTLRASKELPRRHGRAFVEIVLPAYNAAATIPAVADELPEGCADEALLVDDASADATTDVALAHGFDVVRHRVNRGYGANQKTCYVRALQSGAEIVVMVHADNQYDPSLVPDLVQPIENGDADVVMGSRLLRDRAIAGGMPRWKWLGNRFLSGLENLAFRRAFSEYHTGYRAFSAKALREVAFLRNSDGFIFDQEIIAQLVARGLRVVEVPIPTRYFKEASSVSFPDSVRYGLQTLVVLARYRIDGRLRNWTLLRRPAATINALPGRHEPLVERV
jgi:2-polyprenyl-3-methyl-5-hydroxy-6-metoxy-1,4-benzoquinol methylase